MLFACVNEIITQAHPEYLEKKLRTGFVWMWGRKNAEAFAESGAGYEQAWAVFDRSWIHNLSAAARRNSYL